MASFYHVWPVNTWHEMALVTYLDERWFYTTDRCRRIKRLPKGDEKEDGADFIVLPKVRSRRFLIKGMFMRVCGRPIQNKNFDGKLHLEKVSKITVLKKMTTHQNFCNDWMLNNENKDGG